jgi:tRNA G37 N-methylase Trm5
MYAAVMPAPDRDVLFSLDAEAHEAVRRMVRPGDFVVDATAGNGHDTVFLAGLVGPAGRVLAFDVQEEAVAATRDRCARSGYAARVRLIRQGHEQIARHVDEWLGFYPGVAAGMFNLGFLPGSDKSVITRAETTLAACRALLPYLTAGGLISLHAYTGHQGGERETEALVEWAGRLPWRTWRVLRISQHNKPENGEQLVLIRRRVQP